MFARGALNDPEIFSRYLSLRRGGVPEPKTPGRTLALVRRLCQLYVEYGMDRPGLLKMRTLVPRFLKGLPGAREIRRDIVFCATWEQVFGTLDKHFHGREEQWS